VFRKGSRTEVRASGGEVQYRRGVAAQDLDYLQAIAEHSEGFASVAEGNFTAAVEHCPGWSVADLVWHLTSVHWFWATIVDERLSAPPDESTRPGRPRDDELIERFRMGARRLVEVLERAPDDASVWTWAPAQHDVAFVARHQVQEAAVHHWDAAHAAGTPLELEVNLADDAVSEFLAFSVASEVDPAEPPPAPLGSAFVLASTDSGSSWTVADGPRPGTLLVGEGAAADARVSASASDLLLWLYRRVNIGIPSALAPVIERFKAFTFTE
jgi:uncharacterized protein (TIGR03083 family)